MTSHLFIARGLHPDRMMAARAAEHVACGLAGTGIDEGRVRLAAQPVSERGVFAIAGAHRGAEGDRTR